MIKRIRHTGIVVVDLEESLKFYRDLLGFETVVDSLESGAFVETILGLKGVKVRTVKLKVPCGDDCIELLYYHDPVSRTYPVEINDRGITHVALEVEDVEAAAGRLETANAEFLSGPVVSPDGKVKVVFCRTPEGTYLELVEVLSEQ